MKREVIIRTIAGILSGLAIVVIVWIWHATIWPFLTNTVPSGIAAAVAWVWNVTTASVLWFFGTAHVPRWWYITLSLTFAAIIWRKVRAWYRSTRTPPEPTFLDFTQILLSGVRWRWQWRNATFANLCCFCPQCDRRIRIEEPPIIYSHHCILFCTNCKQVRVEKDRTYRDLENDILLELDHIVRTNEWIKHVHK